MGREEFSIQNKKATVLYERVAILLVGICSHMDERTSDIHGRHNPAVVCCYCSSPPATYPLHKSSSVKAGAGGMLPAHIPKDL
jgi:hypothetical protein